MDNYSPNLNNEPEPMISIQPKKKGFFKRKKKLIIFVIIGILIIGGTVGAIIGSQKVPEYTTIFVAKGTLKQTVEVTGKVESAESIDLNFKSTGRIKEISIKAGDSVTAGQQLAKLEAGALQSQVTDAQAKVSQAQADYNELLAGAAAEDIVISENTVAQKLQDLNSAENNLTNLKLSRETELLNLKETAVNTLNNEISSAQAALEEIDNTLNDTDAQTTLSVMNTGALTDAELSQELAENKFSQSKNEINLININSTNNGILNALDNLKLTLNSISTALVDTLDVLAATLTNPDLTETELDTLKSNIKTKITSINTAKTNVQTAKSNWTNKISYYQDQVTIYEDSVKKAQSALDVAVAQLNLKKSPPRQFEIDAARAKVTQAQAALTLALANLNDAIITAPVDGIITKKNYNVGEQTSLTTPVLEMIGKSNFQIEVDIPESDITKLQIGQEAEITLDAYTDDQIFQGIVTFIDPAETIISDVVYYKVKVDFKENSVSVKSGMTANLTICTNKKDDVLFVPARAVRSQNGEKYVEIVTSSKGKKVMTEERAVTTGMRGDEGIEIISGLEEGDEVVTFVKE